jgi:hypothetical protein
MKPVVAILIFIASSLQLFAQSDAIEKFFSDYQENENFSVVYVSPKMFQMVVKATSEQNNQELNSVLKDLKGLRILTTNVNSDKIYKEANKRIPTKEYEELMTVRDKGSNIRFLTKETDSIISELLMIVGGANEFMMLSFVGNIDLNKISKLAKSLDIKGVEYLDNIDKKKK